MELHNSFEVDAPVERVWSHMLDVEKVVPCMPGASLTEKIDDDNYKGKVTVKLGPVSLTYAGVVTFTERDEAARRVVLKARGTEQRGKGAASATITSTLNDRDGKTNVEIVQVLNVQGQAAQFGRGMMQDVSARLTKQFADCLQASVAGPAAAIAPAPAGSPPAEAAPSEAGPGVAAGAGPSGAPSEAAGAPPAGSTSAEEGAKASAPPGPMAVEGKPLPGFQLAWLAVKGAVVRFFRRLFGRSRA